MNITEQITLQIDSLVGTIAKYGTAVQAEEARTAAEQKKAVNRAENEKSSILLEESKYLEKAKKARDNELRYLEDMKNIVKSFEGRVEKLVPRSTIQSIPTPKKDFTPTDADALIHRIQETGFWAMLKKLLSIGSYDTNKNMAAELYGQMYGAYQYYDGQMKTAEQNYMKRTQKLASTRQRKITAVKSRYAKEKKQEDNYHFSKKQELNIQKQTILSDSRYNRIVSLLQQAEAPLGIGSQGWQHYLKSNAIPENLLVGTIIHPCNIRTPSSAELELLKSISCYVESANGFSVPLTVPGNQSLQICANAQQGDVMLAAQVFQSIIARMIRFMPPKSFRAYFFDPVNRGTALGNLIHLTGDGKGRVCKYALSPQDITAQLEQLTKKVDNTCRILTTAGCKDINAYNSIPRGGRITYIAVIIHDYPHGLDTAALGYLQVLISKAKQCGISILLSTKPEDKIEHKAKEVLDQIHREFWTLQIPDIKHATLEYGCVQRRFKPSIPSIESSYFSEVNQAFTYQAPVDNSFGTIFPNPPTLRSAIKGLSLPFAVTRTGAVVDLRIGYDSCVYGLLTGDSGAGKTRMLHMLIASAEMHYRPEELEMWVVDYKRSEFILYNHHCPPHIRYIIADDSSEITYSVLDELSAEIHRRNNEFIKAGKKDFVSYCESTDGKKQPIPRLFVIIDEFHRMAQAASEESNANGLNYKKVLENIFAEGRSAGIVLLICDQQLSNGLEGLTQKSRDMIGTRLAMRNSFDEIRQVLSVENGQMTEELRKTILDETSGLEGSVIYRRETAGDPNVPFSNKIEFLPCRGIYIKDKECTEVAERATAENSSFRREKVFYYGAVRKKWSFSEIQDYEKANPQRDERGPRFYIGTPIGIQRCFYFNLKTAESGENILLVGSDSEKRISILKSVLICAERYGYQINLLVSKAAQIYRQNKEFFHTLENVNIISSFPEICNYIGERANQLRAFYADDEDVADELNGTEETPALTVFVGLEELYTQMETNPNAQRTAWTASTNLPLGANVSVSTTQIRSSGDSAVDSQHFSLNSAEYMGGTNSGGSTIDPVLQASLDDIDSLLSALSADAQGSSEQMKVDVPPKFAGPSVPGFKGYNAIGDLALLLSDGWKIGTHFMLVLDRGMSFNKMRQIKIEGNFNHRIALTMSSDEAQMFMAKTRLMRSLVDAGDTISAVYEHLGGREQCFRPYVF